MAGQGVDSLKPDAHTGRIPWLKPEQLMPKGSEEVEIHLAASSDKALWGNQEVQEVKKTDSYAEYEI